MAQASSLVPVTKMKKAQAWTLALSSGHEQLNERNCRSFIELEKYLTKVGEQLNIGTISAVCLIDWRVFRQTQIGLDLNKISPNLVTWAACMNQHYDFLAETKPR